MKTGDIRFEDIAQSPPLDVAQLIFDAYVRLVADVSQEFLLDLSYTNEVWHLLLKVWSHL